MANIEKIKYKIFNQIFQSNGFKSDAKKAKIKYQRDNPNNSEKININACRFCKGYGDAVETKNEPHRQMSSEEIKAKKTPA